MKNIFLKKLNKENKLVLVKPNKNISDSYIIKADNCLKSASLLLKNELLKNSISSSYYAMYNSLQA